MSIFWSDADVLPAARAVIDAAGELIAPQPRAPGSQHRVDEADAALVSAHFRGSAEAFARAPRLRVVARFGIGYDNIDVAAATAAGVCIVNTPSAPTASTAEFAIGLMLSVSRRIPRLSRMLAEEKWSQGPEVLGAELDGKTLGLIGCGRIGRRVAEVGRALQMRVRVYDPFAAELPAGVARADSLHELLASSDVVSLHVPSRPETRRLLGPAEFRAIKPGAILINTARGPVVDEAALLEALNDGRVSGAGLDVWDPEPPARDHPLLRHPAVVGTPHIAAFTREGRLRAQISAAEQAIQCLRGEQPPHLVNPEVWDTRRRG